MKITENLTLIRIIKFYLLGLKLSSGKISLECAIVLDVNKLTGIKRGACTEYLNALDYYQNDIYR